MCLVLALTVPFAAGCQTQRAAEETRSEELERRLAELERQVAPPRRRRCRDAARGPSRPARRAQGCRPTRRARPAPRRPERRARPRPSARASRVGARGACDRAGAPGGLEADAAARDALLLRDQPRGRFRHGARRERDRPGWPRGPARRHRAAGPRGRGAPRRPREGPGAGVGRLRPHRRARDARASCRRAPSRSRRPTITAGTRKIVGGAAAAGAIIGAIKDGKEGFAKGALLGGAAGTGAVLVTRGRDIEIPAGSRWTVRLKDTVRL